MSLERALAKITHAKLAVMLMVVCALILIHPLFLPVPVSSLTNDFYGYIKALKPGDKVVIAGPYGPSTFNGERTFLKALINSIAAQGAKFVIWGGINDPSLPGTVGSNPSLDRIALYCGFNSLYGYKYGVDYAYLPYIPGEETAIAGLATNIRSTFSVDVYGTSIDQIPLFANLNSLPDFQLAIFGDVSYTVPEMFVRQWPAKYPSVTVISYSLFTLIGSFYPQYIKGDLDSSTGFAEYEYLTKTVGGEYVLRMDVRGVNVTLTFVLIALTNIAMIQSRRSRKKLEVKPSGTV
jgi:hypothetical protein